MAAFQRLCCLALIICLHSSVTPTSLNDPPRIKEEDWQRQKVVTTGTKVRLLCPIVAIPAPIIRWYKDGEEIDETWLVIQANQRVLKIKSVTVEHTGTYRCQGVNGYGSEEVTMRLIVIDPHDEDVVLNGVQDNNDYPSSVNQSPTHFSAPRLVQVTPEGVVQRPVGSSARLKCTAEGNPRPKVVWIKDGEVVEVVRSLNVGRTDSMSRGFLQLNKLMPRDGGRYMCVVTNVLGQDNHTFTVDVIEPIRSKPDLIGPHPTNTTVTSGTTTFLQCQVRSEVPPHIQWLKRVRDDVTGDVMNHTVQIPVLGPHRYRVLQSSHMLATNGGSYLNKLSVKRASVADSGVYVCLGANSRGYTFREAYLTVLPLKTTPEKETGFPTVTLIIVVIALVVLVAIVAVCYMHRKKKTAVARETTNTEVQNSLMGQKKPPAQVQAHRTNRCANGERVQYGRRYQAPHPSPARPAQSPDHSYVAIHSGPGRGGSGSSQEGRYGAPTSSYTSQCNRSHHTHTHRHVPGESAHSSNGHRHLSNR